MKNKSAKILSGLFLSAIILCLIVVDGPYKAVTAEEISNEDTVSLEDTAPIIEENVPVEPEVSPEGQPEDVPPEVSQEEPVSSESPDSEAGVPPETTPAENIEPPVDEIPPTENLPDETPVETPSPTEPVIVPVPVVVTNPSVVAVSSPILAGTFKSGIVPVVVTFDRAVYVKGHPELVMSVDGSSDASAEYLFGSGTSRLFFRYRIMPGDHTDMLDYNSSSALALGVGSIRDKGGRDALLDLPNPGSEGSLSDSSDIQIDAASKE